MSVIYTIPNRVVANGRIAPILIKDEFTLPNIGGSLILKLTEVPFEIPGIVVDGVFRDTTIFVREKVGGLVYEMVNEPNSLMPNRFFVNSDSYRFGYITLMVDVGQNNGKVLEIYYNGIGSVVRAEDINEIVSGSLLADGAIKSRHFYNSSISVNSLNSNAIESNEILINGNITNGKHAVTKEYVYGLLQGLDIKGSVKVATTENLNCNFSDNKLTSVYQEQLVIDEIQLSIGDRVLVKDQFDKRYNGIYEVESAGGAGYSYILKRASDFDSNEKISSGAYTGVESGTVNGKSGWILVTQDPIVLNATDLNFQHFYHAGASWVLSGNNIYNNNSGNVGIGSGTPSEKLEVNGNTKVIGNINVSGEASFKNSVLVDSSGNLSLSAKLKMSGTEFNAISSNNLLVSNSSGNSLLLKDNGNIIIGGDSVSNEKKVNCKGDTSIQGTLYVGIPGDSSEKTITASSSENVTILSGGIDSSDSASIRLYGGTYPLGNNGCFQLLSGSNILVHGAKNGNVGIGNINPEEKIDISGNIKLPGDSYISFKGVNEIANIRCDGTNLKINNLLNDIDTECANLKIKSDSVIFGKNIGANKVISIDNSTTNNPFIRYNTSLSRWEFSDDGVTPRTLSNNSSAPQWIKFTKSYSDFASSPSSILWFIPAGGILHAVKIKHSVAFSGVGVSYFKISLGVNGGFSKYASPFEVTSAPSQTNFYVANSFFCEDSTGWNVWVLGQAYDSNMAIMTNPSSGAGQVDIWLLVSMAS